MPNRLHPHRVAALQKAEKDGVLTFVAGDPDAYTYRVRIGGEETTVPGDQVEVWLKGVYAGYAHGRRAAEAEGDEPAR
jgi:hypothetical protein